jgi:hypothetical protein
MNARLIEMHEPVANGTTERGEAQSKTGGWSRLGGFCQRLFSLAAAGQPKRLLRVRETLSLGEKRFLAVVEYDGRKLLIAGTPQQISLLERLDEKAPASSASATGLRSE